MNGQNGNACRGWGAVLVAILCVAGLSGCPHSNYSELVAETVRKRAQYVASFRTSVARVEQAVRSSLSDHEYDIVGAAEGEEGVRTVQGRRGEMGAPDSQTASVVIQPDPNREGVTAVYVDTDSFEGEKPPARPIFEAIERRLEDVERVSTPTSVASGRGEEETGQSGVEEGEATGGREPERLVRGVPQSSAYAVVIGIEKYRDLSAPTGAASDAERMTRLFREGFGIPDDQIRTLVDEHATKTDIRAALEWAASSVSGGGRIYFYYAGHGSPDPRSSASRILPFESSRETLRQTGLILDDVVGRLEESAAKSVVAFVDSCFSGQGGRSVTSEGQRPTVPVELVDEGERGASILYSASKSDQISGPNAEGDGGLFTDVLFRALGRGRADVDGDGQITVAELDTYVTPRVAREADKLSRDQEPQLRTGAALERTESLPLIWGLSAQ